MYYMKRVITGLIMLVMLLNNQSTFASSYWGVAFTNLTGNSITLYRSGDDCMYNTVDTITVPSGGTVDYGESSHAYEDSNHWNPFGHNCADMPKWVSYKAYTSGTYLGSLKLYHHKTSDSGWPWWLCAIAVIPLCSATAISHLFDHWGNYIGTSDLAFALDPHHKISSITGRSAIIPVCYSGSLNLLCYNQDVPSNGGIRYQTYFTSLLTAAEIKANLIFYGVSSNVNKIYKYDGSVLSPNDMYWHNGSDAGSWYRLYQASQGGFSQDKASRLNITQLTVGMKAAIKPLMAMQYKCSVQVDTGDRTYGPYKDWDYNTKNIPAPSGIVTSERKGYSTLTLDCSPKTPMLARLGIKPMKITAKINYFNLAHF